MMAELTPKNGFINNPPEIRMHQSQSLPTMLQTLDFPATSREVIAQLGKVELLWTRSEPITLEDAMREIPQGVFETSEDLAMAILSTIRLAYGDHSVEDSTPILSDKNALPQK